MHLRADPGTGECDDPTDSGPAQDPLGPTRVLHAEWVSLRVEVPSSTFCGYVFHTLLRQEKIIHHSLQFPPNFIAHLLRSQLPYYFHRTTIFKTRNH